MNIELLFNVANISYLAGTILLIRRVIKNRNKLNDFDPYGSLANFIGMSVNCLALIGLTLYTTAIISTPTMIFWLIASIYSFKNRKKKYRDIRKWRWKEK